MKVIPKGYKVLVKVKPVEETTKSGIVIVTPDKKKYEQVAQTEGVVLALGKDCWDKFSEPWAKEGDVVLFQRYSGMRIPDKKGNFIEDLLLLNDLDISAIVLEDDEDANN
jgi:co-chaperonin GroES (HSP10)